MSTPKKPAKKAKRPVKRKKPVKSKIDKKDGKADDERAPFGKRNEVSYREFEYVEGLLQKKTKTQSALDAGFAKSVAEKTCHAWIGKTRETSKKPHLFDYYQERVKEKLRLFDITKESVLNELKMIAFSDITNYIHIPTKEDIENEKRGDIFAIAQFLGEQAKQKDGDPDPVAPGDYRRGGTIRLKVREEIPEELLPAIAEIAETRDGIRLKLHSKMDALEKLARYLKLYEETDPEGDGPNVDTINIVINGSKSPIFQKMTEEEKKS